MTRFGVEGRDFKAGCWSGISGGDADAGGGLGEDLDFGAGGDVAGGGDGIDEFVFDADFAAGFEVGVGDSGGARGDGCGRWGGGADRVGRVAPFDELDDDPDGPDKEAEDEGEGFAAAKHEGDGGEIGLAAEAADECDEGAEE